MKKKTAVLLADALKVALELAKTTEQARTVFDVFTTLMLALFDDYDAVEQGRVDDEAARVVSVCDSLLDEVRGAGFQPPSDDRLAAHAAEICDGIDIDVDGDPVNGSAHDWRKIAGETVVKNIWYAARRAHFSLRHTSGGCDCHEAAQAGMRLYLNTWVAGPLLDVLRYLTGKMDLSELRGKCWK